ncbi:TRIC cation channel family protein [Pseudostreptobacillus hongkongensis]|uniref:trimeric intracellular cation channel family protein n=1 Tax=Pseudostreptobacillus hongkongensis TaxID=1162717 RepID=UPI0028D5EB26|nr:TRIC cation channel family protein [Pseudostreptobacillus hongkongensis]
MDFETFLYIANFFGVLSFAASGVFKGIKHNYDIFGISILAIATAVGGGITRDVMLNNIPNAIVNPHDIYLSIITTLIIYLPYFLFKNKFKNLLTRQELVNKIKLLVLIFDAVGLSIFIYLGANIAINNNLNTLGIIMMATVTAVGGGVIRDIMSNESPIILKEDIYAVLCVIGGFLYKYMIIDLSIDKIRTTIILFSLVLIIRLIVIFKKLNLPK